MHRDFILPYVDSHYRSLEILPYVGSLGGFKPRGVEHISYLLTSEDPNIIGKLAMLEAEIISAIELIAERSKIHMDDVQKKFDAYGIKQEQELTDSDLESLLGDRVIQTVEMVTNQMIQSIELVISGTEEMIPRLHALLKNRYPGKAVLTMDTSE